MNAVSNFEFSRPQTSVLTTAADRTLHMAGQRGGKTALMGPLAYSFVSYLPKSVGLIAANTYAQLSNSTLKEIFKVWAMVGVYEYTRSNTSGIFVINKQPPPHFKKHEYLFVDNYNKIYFKNGAVIMTASLDNYNAMEGIELAWAMLDETADTKEDALRTVITARLSQRGIFFNEDINKLFPYADTGVKPCNPLYVFSKPGRVEWINTYFGINDYKDEIIAKIFSKTDYFEKKIGNRHVVIHSTYHNEKNLPDNYIENRKKDLTKDEVERLVYGSPFAKSGVEYYLSFSDSNIGTDDYTDNYPIHLSFDFNVNPYMTLQVWQIIPGDVRDKAICIDEYAMKSPKSTIEHTCRAFMNDYGHLCDAGVYIYGDVSGHSKQPLKEARNFYEIVKKELSSVINGNSLRLLKQNPRDNKVGVGTIGRREFMNSVLRGRYDVDIIVNERCKYTIADFHNIKEDPNGAKLKNKVEIEGVKCEQYGHMSDAADAIICYLYGKYLRKKL